MVVFPDNIKTWIIGDGYSANPSIYDPYYVGVQYLGFYKNTDIGYLRFIFFFGILGMISMVTFFIGMCSICFNRFENMKILMVLILIVNLIIWFKATTDLLPIFAILLCITKSDQQSYEASLFERDLI